MTKVRRIERKLKATREVTLRLHGYPEYNRALSGYHEGQWFVDLDFRLPSGNIGSLCYFVSNDYAKSLAKYEALKGLVEP